MDTPQGPVVDEIKGIFKELDTLKEPILVHLAQAKCYAYIYARQNGLEEIGVQMTYCNMETEEIKRFQSTYAFEELEAWFQELTASYERWARYQIEWRKKRNASIRQVEFPFSYREGQKELVTSVYRTILRKKKLFVQAPTGVGKTISTVFRRKSHGGRAGREDILPDGQVRLPRTVAWQAFDSLKAQDLRMKVIVLTAKEKICFCEKPECNPDYCPYAKGHFDRINDAVYEMITTSDDMSRQAVEEQAKKWQVCPFEMCLDLSNLGRRDHL